MVFRLVPYEWLENQQYNQFTVGVNPYVGDTNYWYLDLVTGSTAGVGSISIDSRLEKRFTSYKFLKEGKNPVTGSGGDKREHRQVRYKDRERENMDLTIGGWFEGDNAQLDTAQLDYFAKRSDLCVLLVQDEFTTFSGAWGFSNPTPLASDPNIINDMDSTADWIAGTYGGPWNNGNVDLLTTDQVQGSACIRYEETSALGDTYYGFRYNPTGATIGIYSDSGATDGYLHFWLKSSKSSADWQEAVVFLIDGAVQSGDWNLKTVSAWNANTWTEIELHLGDLSGSPGLYTIDMIDVRFKTEVADTADIDIRLDFMESYTPSIRKHDIPFYTVEGLQTQKRGGRDICRFDYTLKLKRIKSPPR